MTPPRAGSLKKPNVVAWERRRAALPTYHELDTLAGTWGEVEAAAFLQAVANFEHVDPALWQ